MGTVTIVSQGKALAEIVLEPRAGSVLRAAAESLQEIVHRRTGVALPIREGGESLGEGTNIHLATCDRSEKLNEALGELGRQPVIADRPGREGFLLLSEKRGEAACVVINGCDDLGTFHGSLIERGMLTIRSLIPGFRN